MQIGKWKAGSSSRLVIALLAFAGLCFAASGALRADGGRDPGAGPLSTAHRGSAFPGSRGDGTAGGRRQRHPGGICGGRPEAASRGWAPTCSRRNSLPTRDAGCDWRAVRGVPGPTYIVTLHAGRPGISACQEHVALGLQASGAGLRTDSPGARYPAGGSAGSAFHGCRHQSRRADHARHPPGKRAARPLQFVLGGIRSMRARTSRSTRGVRSCCSWDSISTHHTWLRRTSTMAIRPSRPARSWTARP